MTTHSSILAWRITWTEEPGRLAAVHGFAKSQTLKQLSTHTKPLEKGLVYSLIKKKNKSMIIIISI